MKSSHSVPSGNSLISNLKNRAFSLDKWKRLMLNLCLLTIGACIFAAGLNGVLIPKRFLSGGVIGVALIFHYLAPEFNIGFIYFCFNIP
jgi:uncharacterized membrane-anchored protein YitT (DUF2179 family)